MNPLPLLLVLLGAQDEISIEHFAGRGARGVAPLVAKVPGRLRVALGGGAETLALGGFWAESLQTAGLDAVALGAGELQAVKADPGLFEKLPFVAANIVDGAGKSVARTHVVVKAGGTRVALVGVARPAREMGLPEGWRIDDPAAALEKLAPALAGEADAVVILAVMDRIEAATLLKGRSWTVLVPARGANDPSALKAGDGWLAQSPDGQAVGGRLTLSGKSAKNSFEELAPSAQDRERIRALASKHGLEASKLAADKRPAGAPEGGPALAFQPGKPQALWIAAANRALEVRIHSFQVVPEFGGRKAAEGRAWLVVDSEWTNELPMKFVFDRELPVQFEIADFREILFVVVNGGRLARLDQDLTSGPGGLTERPFALPYVGSSRRGSTVFDVPAGAIESLDFRFYDFSHGHIGLPLLAKKDAAVFKPAATAKNEILEVAIGPAHKEKGGAPEGMTTVRIDVRARSVWPYEVDATAFDPKARKGQKIKVPSLGRWEDIRSRVTLVPDGGEGQAAVDASRLADATILLPDATAGDELVFYVPETAKALELRVSFPKMSVPGRSGELQPKALALPVEGAK